MFGHGLRLQSIAGTVTTPETRARLAAAVREVDEVIRDIRTSIFELHEDDADDEDERGLRQQALDVISQVTDDTGLNCAVELSGDLDGGVPADVAGDLITVLRETLTDVVRHAGAARATVTVGAGQAIVVEVAHDGSSGASEATRQRLLSLMSRARVDNALSVERGADGETVVRWQVPRA